MENNVAVEPLIADDLRIIETVRKALGNRAAENTRRVILRERAARIVPVNETQIKSAMSYLHNEPNSKLSTGFNVLTRKFITEDESLAKRFEGYCNALLESDLAPSFVCQPTKDEPRGCTPPSRWASVGSLATHRFKAHGIKQMDRASRARRRLSRNRKKK